MGKIILSTTFNRNKEEKEYSLLIFFMHSRPLRLLSLGSLKEEYWLNCYTNSIDHENQRINATNKVYGF